MEPTLAQRCTFSILQLTDSKFRQYANLISNAHAQYKLVMEEYIAIEF